MISVVDLQEWFVQGNSDYGSEQLRLPTASLTIVFIGGLRDELSLSTITDQLV